MAAASMTDPLAPGRQVGKYQVVRRLATGGMAEIYLARARGIQGFEKYVVLKRILPQFARSHAFVRMFLNEARLAATLDHPNIASVYDIDQSSGVYFFTMEYLHGEDLGFVLHELGERELPLPLEHALSVGVGVAAGLHAAHEKRGPDGKPLGIVHRDVSPQNVVVTFAGGVKLVDFGIAKVTAHTEFTGSGSLKGKFAYMSPEQVQTQPVDRRSDVFSLGILLYEMTTQTRLFKGDSEVATIGAVMAAEVPPPSSRVPGYPPDLEAVVLKALRKDPDERFATARELQLALEAFASAHGLVLSTAALGEWMERTFGPKVEPWRAALDEEGGEPGERAGEAAEDLGAGLDTSLAATRVVGTPVRRSVRPGVRRFALAGAVLAVAGGAGALWQAQHGASLGRAPEPVLVIAASGEVSLDPAPKGALPPPPAAPATPAAPAAAQPVEVETPRRARKDRAARPDPVQQFSAAFQRRQRELKGCFDEYPLEADKAGQLSVRFEADVEGRVTVAEVLPPQVARTPLGACVARVARATTFGRQRRPVAFSIPVFAHPEGTARR